MYMKHAFGFREHLLHCIQLVVVDNIDGGQSILNYRSLRPDFVHRASGGRHFLINSTLIKIRVNT